MSEPTLVVDDDPGLLRLLTIRLRSQKYEVEPADSAARALEVVGRFRPDLVITDPAAADALRSKLPNLNVVGTVAEAVAGLAAEVLGAEAERDPAPVIGPSPQHPAPVPVELLARRHGLPRDDGDAVVPGGLRPPVDAVL